MDYFVRQRQQALSYKIIHSRLQYAYMVLLGFFLRTATPKPVAYAIYILDIEGMFPVSFQFPADPHGI